jgi:hypothetical protein
VLQLEVKDDESELGAPGLAGELFADFNLAPSKLALGNSKVGRLKSALHIAAQFEIYFHADTRSI